MDASTLPLKDWFRVREASEYLGVSRMTIYRWCESGRLECSGLPWFTKISRASLLKIKSQKSQPCC